MTEPVPLTEQDVYLFNEGTHFALGNKLGAQVGPGGVRFSVWAPSAKQVWVGGDFDGWKGQPLHRVGDSGIWSAWIEHAHHGHYYKYSIATPDGEYVEKADPVGYFHQTPPDNASIVWDLKYDWKDDAWIESRPQRQGFDQPCSIYEVHLGSWRNLDGRPMTLRELCGWLPDYVADLGFTHVELMPVMEHPYGGSWGYQLTGFFAPSSRWGTPQDLMALIDAFHQRGVGVILDWVPGHFATDAHGLAKFDGTHLYEHADPRKGFHPDWTTFIFNYGRYEVQSFLISSAAHWIERYHADGIRVDGVASMLYLDYSREEGEWIPNEHGGRENIEAIALLRRMNEHLYGAFPGVQIFAEESTAWEGVTRPTYMDGLGFGFKWDMGWMHDTLQYLQRDPVHRKHHHQELTFRGVYAWNENFVLPLSHDEVVHGKGSLLSKMPGDPWQQHANLRLLFAHMWATPGKKLLFMGGELAQRSEWKHEWELEWGNLEGLQARGVHRLITRLNELYRERPALHARERDPAGFEWVIADDDEQSALVYLRKSDDDQVLVACNFTPVPREGYEVRVGVDGVWEELLNTDAEEYGGSGIGNLGSVTASDGVLRLTLPPLAVLYLRPISNSTT